MKKKIAAVMMGIVLSMAVITGCGSAESENGKQDTVAEKAADEKPTEGAADSKMPEEETAEEDAADEEKTDENAVDGNAGGVNVRVGSLKGPTSMGLVYLMSQAENGEAKGNYTFTMATAADELLPKMTSGELDIALVPANVASVLYQKTQGGISVIDINTLGVLYMVSGDEGISSMEDLKGRTVYLTGKGTTPDYVLRYLLSRSGLDETDVTLEYKSEATEVVAYLAQDVSAIGVLPQPFVTVACMQNDALSIVMDLTAQWDALQEDSGSSLVTGVTIVRDAFLEEYPEAVAQFLEEHKESTVYANEKTKEAAQLVASYGIIEKAPIAEKAMPYCNITYIDGADMKTALSGYLEVLYEQDASSVGESLPADDFYYLP